MKYKNAHNFLGYRRFLYLYTDKSFKDMTKINEKPTPTSREKKLGITQELLKTLFDYKDGKLYWKIKCRSDIHPGHLAGFIRSPKNALPRYIVKINDQSFIGARLIYIWHNGDISNEIDHIDRDSINDNIENLRPAIRLENSRNKNKSKNKTSQYLGVHKITCNGEYANEYWVSCIRVGGKLISLGNFSFTKENEKLAALAYNEAAKKYFGEFANLNVINDD